MDFDKLLKEAHWIGTLRVAETWSEFAEKTPVSGKEPGSKVFIKNLQKSDPRRYKILLI